MKILVIGGGGREHAIIKAIASKEHKIYCAPGNAGTAELATNVAVSPLDIDGLLNFAKTEAIDLTIVGMDDTLMLGVVDAFEAENLRIFGPNKQGALLEGSKAFSKDFMKKYNIPTAEYAVFEDFDLASEYIASCSYPMVVKADGLALGKGVLICNNQEEAKEALIQCMVDEKFGNAGKQVVIEEFLVGREVSVLSFCDGKTILPMASAQDHKRSHDNDEGLNTGGMGTFSPSPFYTEDIEKKSINAIIQPTVEGLMKENIDFKGIIFFGLMLTQDGPKLLEYNARFGDPEAQVVLPRLETPLLDVINSCIDGTLEDIQLTWKKESAVCVICASGGYPVSYKKEYPIMHLDQVQEKGLKVYHAGTKVLDNQVVTNGGRVLGVTALGRDIAHARTRAYEAIDRIEFQDMHFRTDIGIV